MLEKIINYMKIQGLKNTPKRRAVINLFLKEQIYLNPLEVRAQLIRQNINIGIPSIYRILEELYQKGVLRKKDKNDQHLYYFLCFPPENHLHHFFCNNCRHVIHLNYCSFKDEIKDLEGCKVENHYFSIEGLCRDCNTKGE